MITTVTKGQVWCEPGEKLSLDIINKLKRCARYKDDNDKYLKELCTSFSIDFAELPQIDRDYKLMLAGFIVGEGSFNLSAKRSTTARFGVSIVPEFSITQHVNGIYYLLGALKLFGVGTLVHKNKSNVILVYRIGGVNALKKNVIAFWKEYIRPTQSPRLIEERERFIKVIDLLSKSACLHLFLNIVLPLWDSLRKQKGQSNQSFPSLVKAQEFVQDLVKENKR
jgi:hypothetical protein